MIIRTIDFEITSGKAESVNFFQATDGSKPSMFTRFALSGIILTLALPFLGSGQAWAVDADLGAAISTKQMKIAAGSIKYKKATKIADQKLNVTYLTKNKKVLMTGPLGLVISNITPSGAKLNNASGNTLLGSYIQILNSGAQLKKNQKIRGVTLQFSNPTGKKIRYKKTIYSITPRTTPIPETGNNPGTDPNPPVVTVPNAPIADAGVPQTVKAGSLVTLNGSKSKAVKGNLVSYQWQQRGTSTVAIIKNGIAQPSFYAPLDANTSTLVFDLIVKDSNGLTSSPSSVSVTALAVPPPTVHAGIHQLVEGGSTAVLDGSQSFSEGGNLAGYVWTQVSGIPVSLKNANTAQASFPVPVDSVNTDFVFQLTITDLWGRTAAENMTVSVQKPFDIHINDTGMTSCGDYAYGLSNIYTNGLDCNGTDPQSDLVPIGQDAQHGRDFQANNGILVKAGGGYGGFDFTKIDVNGNVLPDNATTWACVRDNHTKLIWEVKTTDNGIHDMNGTYSWYSPDNTVNGGSIGAINRGTCSGGIACDTFSFIAAVNAQKFCGINNWRLPSVMELQGIVNQQVLSPAIDTVYIPNTTSGLYWTGTPTATDPAQAKAVNFNDGSQGSAYKSLNDGKKVGIRLVTKAP